MGKIGRCVVLVGDTHLRTIRTSELGEPSVFASWLAKQPNTLVVRSPLKEID